MLAATGFAPLLVNFQSMTAKPKAGGGSQNLVAWKAEKAYRQGRQEFFHGLGKRAAADGGLSHRGRGAALLQTSPQIFEHCLAPGNPGRGWGRILV